MSTEGIDESLHGLGGIEEIPTKIGVFSRTQKLRSEGTRDSEGFSTWLKGLGFWRCIFETLVLRLCGKGGPSLLVPSGLLISCQSRSSCASFG